MIVVPKPAIQEVLAVYSSYSTAAQVPGPVAVLPYQRSFTQFGGTASSYCGPTFLTNTLSCFSLKNGGSLLASFPIPGALSLTPVYFEDSWLLGTSKGFLLRVRGNPDHNFLPDLGGNNAVFWGTYSRQKMATFRPKPIYTDSASSQPPQPDTLGSLTQGLHWVFASSAEFIGTPIVQNGMVFVLAASEYIQAFDWKTGKLSWAVRLAPDTSLRIQSNTLALTPSELIVGTDLGTLLALNPQTGALLWSWQVPSASSDERILAGLPAGPDHFSGLVAAPLVKDRTVLVSNAESMTQNISLDTHTAQWSYPAGSVCQAKLYGQDVLVGTSDGKVISLNQGTGTKSWSVQLAPMPIASLFVTQAGLLLAATGKGDLFLVDPSQGNLLASRKGAGEVSGEFFSGPEKSEVCLSFARSGIRCYKAVVPK